MTVITWIAEGTWPACVDAARIHAPQDSDIVLLHVTDQAAAEAAHGAHAGLLGRGQPDRDPGRQVAEHAAVSARELLREAAGALGRPCALLERSGHAGREVVGAAAGAGLLILARDGDHTRLGPASLARAGRFVVDHAPCPVLLVWPDRAPGIGTIPPAPHPGAAMDPRPHPGPGPRGHHGPPGHRGR